MNIDNIETNLKINNNIVARTPSESPLDTSSVYRSHVTIDRNLRQQEKTTLNNQEIDLVIMNLINRKRFNYKFTDIIEYMLRCLCLRKIKYKHFKGSRIEWNQKLRKHYHFAEGEDKLYDELDVVTFLKAMRRVKLLTTTLIS